jgi:hypothetical protein
MKIRQIYLTVLSDEQGHRVRCTFCGAVLFQTDDPIYTGDYGEIAHPMRTHPCFQEDAQPPCPTVKG